MLPLVSFIVPVRNDAERLERCLASILRADYPHDTAHGILVGEQLVRDHGTEPAHRFGIMRERVEAMTAIWTQDEASYAGRSVNFERIWSWPKPAQWPHPPVLVGGNGPTVLDRVLAFGDAWMPNYIPGEDLGARIAELRERAGRPVDVIVNAAPAKAAALEELERAGVRRVVRYIPSSGMGPVEAALDHWEKAVAELHGE